MKVISKISLIIVIIYIISLPLNSFARVDAGGGGGSSASVVDTYVDEIKAERNASEFEVGTVTNIVNKVLGFLQIAAGLLFVITVASTGFRYIVETPEVKGDIRKTMFPLIMGLILVFFAATIAKFVINVGSSVEKIGT